MHSQEWLLCLKCYAKSHLVAEKYSIISHAVNRGWTPHGKAAPHGAGQAGWPSPATLGWKLRRGDTSWCRRWGERKEWNRDGRAASSVGRCYGDSRCLWPNPLYSAL